MRLEDLRGCWAGQTVVCMASGPSLTVEDCELVRAAGLRTIVTNNVFRWAPWADILFAMDVAWWKHYGPEANASFKGLKLSYPRCPNGPHPTKGQIVPTAHGISGTYAVSIGIVCGAARVLLLGYDGGFIEGEPRHCHPDHPAPMGNAASHKNWPYKFQLIATYAESRGVKVVNCSRRTFLRCFELGSLEHELALLKGEEVAH